MAGLFSDRHDDSHGGIRILYFMASDFREMGHGFRDLWWCHFTLWSIPSQNDMGLFSSERRVDGI
jgi:hypothetical protein